MKLSKNIRRRRHKASHRRHYGHTCLALLILPRGIRGIFAGIIVSIFSVPKYLPFLVNHACVDTTLHGSAVVETSLRELFTHVVWSQISENHCHGNHHKVLDVYTIVALYRYNIWDIDSTRKTGLTQCLEKTEPWP
jgi:hypothetical protein